MYVGTVPAPGTGSLEEYAFARSIQLTRLFTFFMDSTLSMLMVGFGDFFVQKVHNLSGWPLIW